jgi:hypothetical protein
MRVRVEWLDKVVRTYEQVETVDSKSNTVLYLYAAPYAYGQAGKLIAAIPMTQVREWQLA